MALALRVIIHAIGGFHIQSHIDRDDYFRMDLSLAQENETDQFEKLRADEFIKYVLSDYGSIMHYKPNDFQAIYPSNGSHEITPHDERYLRTIGSRIPSFYDIVLISKHYNCSCTFHFN
ncbi:Metalloendopeptidase [Trichostrongylus colubriformis]|uniref:Metalloendopeptidase n=1 Tax=Trichostrongylus colubriformis TaxID=6319 RepID=A0AAN8ESV0_TRICO